MTETWVIEQPELEKKQILEKRLANDLKSVITLLNNEEKTGLSMLFWGV